jgi:hypothetical protein
MIFYFLELGDQTHSEILYAKCCTLSLILPALQIISIDIYFTTIFFVNLLYIESFNNIIKINRRYRDIRYKLQHTIKCLIIWHINIFVREL